MRPYGLGAGVKAMFFLPVDAALTGAALAALTGAAFFTGAAFAGGALLTARVAKREVDARSTGAGAKAAAPATRVERTASFILVVVEMFALSGRVDDRGDARGKVCFGGGGEESNNLNMNLLNLYVTRNF
jgi:hypothetical protein